MKLTLPGCSSDAANRKQEKVETELEKAGYDSEETPSLGHGDE